ncbi:MAG: hypothetical protein SFX73_09450 [Kofleriaceae bacterium]|nr:hypothetical protein [Kofleriaceae bacterium]
MRGTSRHGGVLAAMAALGACADQDEPEVCTQAACSHGVAIIIPLPDEIAFASGRIRVCKNDSACLAFEVVNTLVHSEENTLGAMASWYSNGPGNRVGIWLQSDAPYPAGFLDGDVYTAMLWNASGAEVGSFRWDVEYTDASINGEGCEPVCRTALLDETNAGSGD